MPQIIPIKDLRNTNEISDICHAKQEPVFVTKNGYGDLVVMSIETYDRLIGSLQIDLAIKEAEEEMEMKDELYEAKDVLPSLRGKHIE